MELQVTIERGLSYTPLISLRGNISHSCSTVLRWEIAIGAIHHHCWDCLVLHVRIVCVLCVHLVICNFNTCIDLCNYQHCSIVTKIMRPFGSYTHSLAVSFLTSVLFCVLLFGDVCHACPHFPLPFFFARAGNSPLSLNLDWTSSEKIWLLSSNLNISHQLVTF